MKTLRELLADFESATAELAPVATREHELYQQIKNFCARRSSRLIPHAKTDALKMMELCLNGFGRGDAQRQAGVEMRGEFKAVSAQSQALATRLAECRAALSAEIDTVNAQRVSRLQAAAQALRAQIITALIPFCHHETEAVELAKQCGKLKDAEFAASAAVIGPDDLAARATTLLPHLPRT